MRIEAVVLLAISAAACAPSGGGAGSEPVNTATADQAGGQMASSIEAGASGFRRTNEPAPAMAAGTSGEGQFLPDFCLHLAEGDTWTDADGDGAPSPAVTLEISCTYIGAEGSVTAGGTVVFSDPNPMAPGFDGSMEFNDLDVVITGTDSKLHITTNASNVNSGQPLGNETFELTHHEDEETTTEFLGLDDTLYGDVYEAFNWDMVLTVTGFQPGNDAPAGSLEVDGGWDVRIRNFFEDFEHAASTAVETVVPLGLDPACPTNIVSGEVAASFDGEEGTATINVTWTGCGSHTVEYIGSSS